MFNCLERDKADELQIEYEQTYRLGMKRARTSPPWLRLASLPTTGESHCI